MLRVFFFLFLFFHLLFYYQTWDHVLANSFARNVRIVKRTRRKRFEFDRQRDGKEGMDEKGREHELEEPRSPSYEKNSQMLSTQYYQSSIHKRATRFAASLKKVTSNLAKNYYVVPIHITSITRSATSERWARGVSGKKGTRMAYINPMRMLLCGQSNRE